MFHNLETIHLLKDMWVISSLWLSMCVCVCIHMYIYIWAFQVIDTSGKESDCQCRRHGLILRSGRSLEGGNVNLLYYFCLENPMDRGAGQAIVHEVAKSRTQLKWLSVYVCIHTHTHTTYSYILFYRFCVSINIQFSGVNIAQENHCLVVW